MNFEQLHSVYLVGIGGIGMSAIARYFNAGGKVVAGYDRTETPLTRQLEKEGMAVHYTENPAAIGPAFRDSACTLVVYTPAVPQQHRELEFFRNNGFQLHKRAAVLGMIAQQGNAIAVAGTHGKTTVSAMVAHILQQRPQQCNAFLGGIPANYNTNCLLAPQSAEIVVEADEFDRSFLHLHPHTAVITSIDADHLDIYGDYSQLKTAFAQFAAQVQTHLIVKKGVDLDAQNTKATVLSYAVEQEAAFTACNIRLTEGLYVFDVELSGNHKFRNIELGVSGLFNVENALAAIAVATLYGVEEALIRKAMRTFSGISRRFEQHLTLRNTGGQLAYIDDYAHHPVELEATIKAARALFPERQITGIFQPHLYSRTRDFAKEFARSLSLLDRVVLVPVYPAREHPIEGINSGLILEKVAATDKQLLDLEQLPQWVQSADIEILLTLGAGNIDKMVPQIKAALQKKLKVD